MKVKCVKVVRRVIYENDRSIEDSNHELYFYVSNDIFQTMWLQIDGPPIFTAGKTYTLNEIADEG